MSFLVPGPTPDATEARRGLVSTVAQTFGGLKRFLHGLRTSKVVFDDETEMTTAPVDPTLESVGTGQSLVADGVGPSMTLKRIRGTGVATVTATSDTVDVNVPVPPVTSLNDSGPGHSIIKVGTGPSLGLKRLVQGSGVVLTPTTEGVEVAAAATAPVTLGSTAGGYSLVSDGTGPDLTIRAVEMGAGLTASIVSGRLRIALDDPGWQVVAAGDFYRWNVHYPGSGEIPISYDITHQAFENAGSSPTLRYSRRGGMGMIAGMVAATEVKTTMGSQYTRSGVTGENRYIFTLPAGYRPPAGGWRIPGFGWAWNGQSDTSGIIVNSTGLVALEGSPNLTAGRWLPIFVVYPLA